MKKWSLVPWYLRVSYAALCHLFSLLHSQQLFQRQGESPSLFPVGLVGGWV